MTTCYDASQSDLFCDEMAQSSPSRVKIPCSRIRVKLDSSIFLPVQPSISSVPGTVTFKAE